MRASVPFLGLLRPFPPEERSSPCFPLPVSVRSVPSRLVCIKAGRAWGKMLFFIPSPTPVASEVPGTQWALLGVVPCGRRVNPIFQKAQWLVCGPEWTPDQTPIVRARSGYCLRKTCLQYPCPVCSGLGHRMQLPACSPQGLLSHSSSPATELPVTEGDLAVNTVTS